MKVYFLVLLFIVIINIFFKNRTPQLRLILSLIMIFIMMSLRVDWSGDYKNYETLFNNVHGLDWSNILDLGIHSEKGYLFLNMVLPTYRWVIIVVSLVYCLGLYVLFDKFIPNKYWILGFLIVFLDVSMLMGAMSGMRNCIAVSAFILGTYLLLKKKRILYIAILVTASFFHSSALLFIPFVFITGDRSKINLYVVLFAFVLYAILAIVTPESWVNTANVLLSNVDVLSGYEEYFDETNLSFGFRGFSFVIIFYMLVLNLMALHSFGYTSNDYLYLKFSLLWFIVMLSPAFGLTSRIYFYTDYLMLAAAITVISRSHNTLIKLSYVACLFVYFGLQFYQFTGRDQFAEIWLIYHSCL